MAQVLTYSRLHIHEVQNLNLKPYTQPDLPLTPDSPAWRKPYFAVSNHLNQINHKNHSPI